MNTTMRPVVALLISVLALAAMVPGHLRAEPGVTAQTVKIGMSAPLTGPLARFGTELARGLKLGLAQFNAAGGVGGREVVLQLLDDAGKPEQAVANTQSLIDSGVLLLTGYHGSQVIESVLPVLDTAGVPLVGAASSAEVLRDPIRRNVFNLRAGAREEAAAMALHLDTIGITDIAVVAQDDALGNAGLEGIKFEWMRLAMRPQAIARIPVSATSAALAQAAQQACKDKPQAMLLVLDATNAVAVIREARKRGCSPQFYVMSDAGAALQATTAPQKELAGVIVSQVLPNPAAASIPLVIEFRNAIEAPGGALSYPSLEGFIYARVITEVLKRCGRDLSRRCVVASLEGKPFDLGGYRVQFSPTERRGSRFVDMTILTAEGRFRS